MRLALGENDALVVVDVQNDFCPGGALAVPDGDKVVPVLNEYIARFHRADLPVLATRDWHPEDHMSFEEQGGTWPPHCIQGTEGAEFHPQLELPPRVVEIKKGDEPHAEAYSGFLGHTEDGTSLADALADRGVERVFVGGLATDYCVRATTLDALDEGLMTVLLLDACRGVDVEEGDSQRATAEMLENGAIAIEFDDLVL